MTLLGRALASISLLTLTLIPSSAAQEPVLGTRSPLATATTDEDRIWAEAGTPLLQSPSPRAPLVDLLPSDTELPVLERRGDWVAVRYRSMKVWFAVAAQPEIPGFELPPLHDPERRLREARARLGVAERVHALGPFTLYTDVEDEVLLERLAVASADLERAYAERYGLQPRLLGNESVVLFREEEDYRRGEEAQPEIAVLDPHGYAGSTVALLSVGGRGAAALRQLLLHELTHLLNRRALARELPPWLEEGLAEDLSYLELDESGRLDPETLSGRGTFMGGLRGRDLGSVRLGDASGTNAWGSSPRAALAWLLHSWNSTNRPSVETLIDLPWTAFVDPGYRAFHYAESGFLIRYLLDDRSGLAPQLKALLGAIAAGEEPTGELIWSRLELPPRRLEKGFYTWLLGQAAAYGVPRPVG